MYLMKIATLNRKKSDFYYYVLPAIILALIYIAITLFISIHLLHDSYQSGALDLGTMAQSLKYTLQGKILYNTPCGMSQLAYHFSPVLLLLVPIYWLFPHVQTLLVVQAGLFGLAGCLVYTLCRVNKLEHRASLFVELLFFINPLLWGTALFDFHEVAFAIPALFLLFIGIQTKRKWMIIIGLIIALTSKEDVILTVAIWALGMTLYYLWKDKKINKIYPLILLLAVFAYALAIGVSAIASNGEFPRILTYSTVRFQYLKLPLGEAIKAGLQNLFSSGSLFLFLAYLAPLGFLPLVSYQWCFPGLVVLLENMMSTCPAQHSQLLQSQAPAIPFLFIGFITTVVWFKNNEQYKTLSNKLGKHFPLYFGVLLVVVSLSYLPKQDCHSQSYPISMIMQSIKS